MDDEGTSCFFSHCNGDTVPGHWACLDHTDKPRCLVDQCRNMVYARHRCVHHGGKKVCTVPDCGITRRLGDFCSKHATQKKRCSTEGCETLAHLQGKCVRHGGGRRCKVHECTSHARNGPYCGRHFKLLGPPAVAADAPSDAATAATPRISRSKAKARPASSSITTSHTPTAVHGGRHGPFPSPQISAPHPDDHAELPPDVSSPPPELLHLDLNDDSGFENDDVDGYM